MDAELEKARAREPDWDDMREQRVLQRVLEEKRRPRGRRAVALAAIVIAGVAIVLAMLWPPSGAPTAERPVPTPEDHARLVLSDGSEVHLETNARVQVEVDSRHRIALVHREGEAEYDVAHRPEREFVVHVRSVRVRVRGTRFTVALRDEWVEVGVIEGRVEVTAPDRTATLGDGESVRMRADAVAEVEPPAEPRPPEREAPPSLRPEETAPDEDETAVEQTPRAPRPEEPEATLGFDEWLARADAARGEGRVDEAARLYRAALAAHPRDRRRAAALFSLGQMERARGAPAEAARAFDDAYRAGPRGAIAEDALAQAALAWALAGDHARAREKAVTYLRDYPAGLHAERMRNLTGAAPP
jgi:transmembrane sensor